MPERIDELNAGIRALATATHEVSTEVAKAVKIELDKDQQAKEKDRRVWRRVGVALGLAIVLSLAFGAGGFRLSSQNQELLEQSRERGLQNRQLTQQNARLLQRIEDCTTPGRKCYDDGQKRTAALLQRLIDAQIAVAVCSRAGTAEDGMEACVTRRLAAR